MAWFLSIFILDVLNRVSGFGEYMISVEELSVIGSVWAAMSSFKLLRIMVLSYLLSSSS